MADFKCMYFSNGPFEELYRLLNSLHTKFSILEIRESRLRLHTQLLENMNFENYYIKQTPTGKGMALLCFR